MAEKRVVNAGGLGRASDNSANNRNGGGRLRFGKVAIAMEEV